MLLRFILSDILKIRRRPLLWVHLCIPLIGIAIFLAYYSYTPWTPENKAMVFMAVVAIVFPTLIGIVCSMAVEQESSAGNFQQMLTSSHKLIPFLSKLILLLVLGFFAVLFTSIGFEAGFSSILNFKPFSLSFYIISTCILFGSSIFLYIFHLAASLRFGRGASIGIGIVESLLSFILVSNVGDGKWQYIPCAWGARFIQNFEQYRLGVSDTYLGLNAGIGFCTGGTIVMIIIICIWFMFWEGRQSQE